MKTTYGCDYQSRANWYWGMYRACLVRAEAEWVDLAWLTLLEADQWKTQAIAAEKSMLLEEKEGITYPRYRYKFQFNNDVDSCEALKSMIGSGWTIYDCTREDGYLWFLLQYEH